MATKLLYKMGEVAETLGEETSAVRYWTDYFSKYVKPERNAKGNRLYHPEDVENLKLIHYLIKEQGLTLDGVMKRLSTGKGELDYKMLIVNRLKTIKSQLEEIYDNL